jgi:hypothetical protein
MLTVIFWTIVEMKQIPYRDRLQREKYLGV